MEALDVESMQSIEVEVYAEDVVVVEMSELMNLENINMDDLMEVESYVEPVSDSTIKTKHMNGIKNWRRLRNIYNVYWVVFIPKVKKPSAELLEGIISEMNAAKETIFWYVGSSKESEVCGKMSQEGNLFHKKYMEGLEPFVIKSERFIGNFEAAFLKESTVLMIADYRKTYGLEENWVCLNSLNAYCDSATIPWYNANVDLLQYLAKNPSLFPIIAINGKVSTCPIFDDNLSGGEKKLWSCNETVEWGRVWQLYEANEHGDLIINSSHKSNKVSVSTSYLSSFDPVTLPDTKFKLIKVKGPTPPESDSESTTIDDSTSEEMTLPGHTTLEIEESPFTHLVSTAVYTSEPVHSKVIKTITLPVSTAANTPENPAVTMPTPLAAQIVNPSNQMVQHYPVEFKTYNCDICDMVIYKKDILERHMATVHSDFTNFYCKICAMRFNQKNLLWYHMLSHAKDSVSTPPLPAATVSIAPIQATSSSKLVSTSEQTVENDPEEDEVFECDICLKILACRDNLRRHINTIHAPLGVFQCKLCYKRFNRKDRLRYHITTHAKKRVSTRPLPAATVSIAPIQATSSSKLVSTSEQTVRNDPIVAKLYDCDVCGKLFSTSDYLSRHLAAEHGD